MKNKCSWWRKRSKETHEEFNNRLHEYMLEIDNANYADDNTTNTKDIDKDKE